jgi:cytochrome c-type biogenesis protein CcmH
VVAPDPAACDGLTGNPLVIARVIRLVVLVVALAVAAGAWAVDPTQLPDPRLQARYEALTHELRCMQCQNESLADSPVDLAADLRREVRDLLLAGKSDDEIRDWMAARYGDFILFRPRYSVRNAWLWGAPAVLLLIGAWAGWRIIRQRTTLLATDQETVDEDGYSR